MKWIGLLTRILIGSIFVVFGTNGLSLMFLGHSFIPVPAPVPGSKEAWYMSVIAGSYILKTVKIVEVAGGLMLISGFFMPLGAILLAPIALNIFLYHLYYSLSGLPIAILLCAGELMIGFVYWRHFRPLFSVIRGAS